MTVEVSPANARLLSLNWLTFDSQKCRSFRFLLTVRRAHGRSGAGTAA